MNDIITNFFHTEKISEVGCIPYSELQIINSRLMPQNISSAIMFLAPYDIGKDYSDGISCYAHVLDYHNYFNNLFNRAIEFLNNQFQNYHFYGFSDHSPINEKIAAAKAGLGVIGCNSLLINPVYGSYVFIGAILTDMELPYKIYEIKKCIVCKKCIEKCPTQAIQIDNYSATVCLSALSQKKKINNEEFSILKKNNVAWGCDICQRNCPMNTKRKSTPIPYFQSMRFDAITTEQINDMSNDEFQKYAFSWKGKNRIIENIENLK